jgi:integrase/recombinase XerD
MTWDVHIKNFKAFHEVKGSSIHTIDGYTREINAFRNFIERNFNGILPVNVNYDHSQKFIDDFVNKGASVHRIYSLLISNRSFYTYLLKENIIPINPFEIIPVPKLELKLNGYIPSIEEISWLLASFETDSLIGLKNRAIFEVMYASGLKPKELINLKIEDLIFPNSNSDYDPEEIGLLKIAERRGKYHLVPIGQEAMKFICLYKNKVRPFGRIETKFEDYLFLNNNGVKFSNTSLFMTLKKHIEKVRFSLSKKINLNTFRHSFAVHLLQNGADIGLVSIMMGYKGMLHAEKYAQFVLETKADAMKKHKREKVPVGINIDNL